MEKVRWINTPFKNLDAGTQIHDKRLYKWAQYKDLSFFQYLFMRYIVDWCGHVIPNDVG